MDVKRLWILLPPLLLLGGLAAWLGAIPPRNSTHWLFLGIALGLPLGVTFLAVLMHWLGVDLSGAPTSSSPGSSSTGSASSSAVVDDD